ncbi:MAG: hypothetical protein PF549_04385 [Patescibacteria group bacterium]|jgi:hypothetical protein|nr:hypothetical protein [Patescibacteria group bacterium]
MYKNKKILILGAGQIGESCAVRFISDKPKEVIMHTLTQKESELAINNVKNEIKPGKTKLTQSWGNILVPASLMHVKRSKLINNKDNLDALLEYYYANLSDEVIIKSALYKVIAKYKPDLIIDSINTATVVGYLDDPYSLPRNLINDLKENKKNDWQSDCRKLLSSSIVPSLIRFTQVIQKSIKDFDVKCFIKVSTTGLGGMGINLMYTHGDINEPGMSSGILGKVAAAGVFHQLMWSLSHTPGYNLRIVAPAALVGWQPVRFGKFRSHGLNVPVVDNKKVSILKENNLFEINEKVKKSSKSLEMPFVDSGENSAYSLYEMHAITTLGQMESITRDEVAEAVYQSAYGSTRYDLLTSMDYASLGPSYAAKFQRDVVLKKLQQIQDEKKVPSIATNNLGPTVSKHLFELHILLDLVDFNILKLIEMPARKVSELAKEYVYENNIIRKQALSLGLPFLFKDNELLTGAHCFIPDSTKKNTVTKENVEKWANAGWIDLRKSAIRNWQSWLKKGHDGYLEDQTNSLANLVINYQAITLKNAGEILGLIYSLQGGERKKS